MFLSFEWEKKWHANLKHGSRFHFVNWFQKPSFMIERDIQRFAEAAAGRYSRRFRTIGAGRLDQTRDDWQLLLDLTPEGCLAIEVGGSGGNHDFILL